MGYRGVHSLLATAAALIAVVAGQGCGGGTDGEAEEKQVRSAYAQLQARFEAKDTSGVCARISRKAKRQVGSMAHTQPTTCQRDVRQLFKWIKTDATARPKLLRVTVDGDKATVRTRLSESSTGRIPFVEEDDKWKLDNFFGITGPPSPDML